MYNTWISSSIQNSDRLGSLKLEIQCEDGKESKEWLATFVKEDGKIGTCWLYLVGYSTLVCLFFFPKISEKPKFFWIFLCKQKISAVKRERERYTKWLLTERSTKNGC